jgi:membrane protein required for colicin V production
MLPMGNSGEAVRYAAGFVVVFIAVVFTGALLAWLIKKLVEAVGLRPIDRVLGAGFGLIRGAVLLLALAVVINMSPLKGDEWWTESKGADVATAALKEMKPVLPERFGHYLPG